LALIRSCHFASTYVYKLPIILVLNLLRIINIIYVFLFWLLIFLDLLFRYNLSLRNLCFLIIFYIFSLISLNLNNFRFLNLSYLQYLATINPLSNQNLLIWIFNIFIWHFIYNWLTQYSQTVFPKLHILLRGPIILHLRKFLDFHLVLLRVWITSRNHILSLVDFEYFFFIYITGWIWTFLFMVLRFTPVDFTKPTEVKWALAVCGFDHHFVVAAILVKFCDLVFTWIFRGIFIFLLIMFINFVYI